MGNSRLTTFLGGVHTGLGEGNGTPLQYSCLENPMDGGAWWAAVHGVAQSQTRLKRLSSSSMQAYRTKQPMAKQAPRDTHAQCHK